MRIEETSTEWAVRAGKRNCYKCDGISTQQIRGRTGGERMKIKCPKCGSENISQLRQLTGPIWCNDCGFRVENKEINNPFIFNEAEELEKND